jgi:prevent-host-death family protein
MERIGVRELRQNASRYLALVKAGQTVEITDRGTLVARLVPAEPALTGRDRLIADGLLLPAENPTGQLLRGRPMTLAPGSPSTQEMLDEMREDTR